MTARVVVVDTNVVVAGLLTRRADSPVARLLDGMLQARFPFAVSEALLAEYRTVLLRPALAQLHGLAADDVDTVLVAMAQHAIVLPVDLPPAQPGRTAPQAPDPGDQFLWDLLAQRQDLLLVTGDKLLLQDQAMRGRVITPADFWAGDQQPRQA